MLTTAVALSTEGGTGLDEAALIRAAQHDGTAFGLLYECHVDPVYAYLRSRTDCDEDAADLTQQVFLQALDALPRFEHSGVPFRAWLLRIARNLAINFHSRHRPAMAFDLLPEAVQPKCSDDTPTRVENLETLRHLFSTLDPDSRELLLLRFAAQLTVKEIAATTGRSEGATRMRLIRILRSLKEQYNDEP